MITPYGEGVNASRWFSPLALVVVVTGGAVGVAARAVLTVPLIPGDSGAAADAVHPLVVPAVTMAINVVGSFLLGLLTGAIGERMPRLRAFAGAGVLGGFTTYSAFAVHTVTTAGASPIVGLALALVTLFVGALAAAVGLGAGERAAAARDRRTDVGGEEAV